MSLSIGKIMVLQLLFIAVDTHVDRRTRVKPEIGWRDSSPHERNACVYMPLVSPLRPPAVFLHYHTAANSIGMRLREPARCTTAVEVSVRCVV